MTQLTLRCEAEESAIREAEALYAAPGEQVRFLSEVVFSNVEGATRAQWLAKFSAETFTVRETILDERGRVLYAFKDIDGEYPAGAFDTPEVREHHYGVLITREGRTWITPLDPAESEGKVSVDGEPRLLARLLGRSGRWFVGPGEVEDLFQSWDAEPSVGEFVLAKLPDGTYRLDGVPWWSVASDAEVAIAESSLANVESPAL